MRVDIRYKKPRKIISLGGSIIYNSFLDGINIEYLTSTVEMIRRYPNERFLYVVGGGIVARSYIQSARKYGIDEQGQDMIGIEATRLNSLLLALMLSHEEINTNHIRNIFEEHPTLLQQYQVVVTGGTIPGHTTDRVAVQCAAKFGDRHVVNVTEVGYIFDEDPKKYESAKIIREIKGSELIKRWGTEHTPGMNLPIEPRAVKEAIENGVTIHVIGSSIEDLEKALFERTGYEGTLIIPE